MDDDSPLSDTDSFVLGPEGYQMQSSGHFAPEASTVIHPKRNFFIVPPRISEEEKKLYKSAKETSLKHNQEIIVDEVIGRYIENHISYYYARSQGGLAHKFLAIPFLKKYRNLVDEFERKEAAGELGQFDPSAHYIDPASRVKLTVNISHRRATVKISSARSIKSTSGLEVVPDSQDEDAMEVDDGNDESDFEETEESLDRHTNVRSSGRRKQALPFSPMKTRSARMVLIDSDMETGASEKSVTIQSSRRSMRSSRSRKTLKEPGSDSVTDESDLSYSDHETTISRTKAKPKKLVRSKASRPAYGHFRSAADLDDDLRFGEEIGPTQKHRDICEKCHQPPVHRLLRALTKKGKRRSRKKVDEFEESGDEEERLISLGGWVRCLKCPVVAHWKCIAATQRDEILKAARDKDRAEWEHNRFDGDEATRAPEPGKRPGLDANQTTEFICGACMKGGFCMNCMEVALEVDAIQKETMTPSPHNIETTNDIIDNTGSPQEEHARLPKHQLLFRCLTCKRLAHYEHMPPPSPNDTVDEIAQHYIQTWLCADCVSYTFGVDKIIAWRPYPPITTEPSRQPDEPPNYKSSLPREYLVKWLDRSFRRVQWVPHMWLLSTHPAKLKNFLSGGSKVELVSAGASEPDNDLPGPTFEIGDNPQTTSVKSGGNTPRLPQNAIPDAEHRIPPAWKSIDRLLEVFLWRCGKDQEPEESGLGRVKSRSKRTKHTTTIVDSADEMEDALDDDMLEERELAFDQGEQPSDQLVETVSDWEARTGRNFTVKDIELVAWAFIKWQDLGYDEASWDSPPRPDDFAYAAFKSSLERYVYSRSVVVPKHSADYCRQFDNRDKGGYRTRHILKDATDLDIGQDRQLTLMPFQVDGFNWLCNNWWIHQPCILADEMGLGKTVQVATFLGNVAAKFKAFPALVVVPNSTITNWVREFERWAPKLRVVPFYGESKAREIIKKYELYRDKKGPHDTGAKFHVLVTTYEALLNQKDFTPIFRNQPRWEVLVVDEGQRLKSDSSLLFRRLNELHTIQRVIMTGTPLNNNIRELFNLMNFLDPSEWKDLEGLEKEHVELTEELVKQLHNRLRPYFLRRLKSEVLQLPPKNEVIIPVSMAPLQKEVYRSILSHNLELLNGLTKSNTIGAPSKGRINNVLMQLRKCLQHPYLYAEDIEPRGLPPKESHEKLIDASGKLRFLKTLLPKLKERGHRVLLFSQFVIALNVIEDFLIGEGLRYLRLDGNTKGTDRQKGMDEFNKPGSDIFIYLLTTRAGGVGINLFSADTVIIYDPDFNPHQDLQAIARAYRFGQQKTCLVFKLMVKDSAEERIMQVGKKKLVLDHLIVQKMDDEDSAGDDVQSILTYGAQALFDSEESSRDIVYSEQDIEKLVQKTEKEGDTQEQLKEGMSFAFAKVWGADKDTLEEVEDIDQGDSWAQTLQKITEERDRKQLEQVIQSGRGVKRRAAAVFKPNAYREESWRDTVKLPSTNKTAKSVASEGSGYVASENEDSDNSDPGGNDEDGSFEPSQPRPKKSLPQSMPIPPALHSGARPIQYCGLCGKRHGDGPGQCVMTDKSENLAEYREMLLLHADDEPWEDRTAAIEAIDRTLYQRGHIHLIAGQPLHPLRKAEEQVTAQMAPAPNVVTTVPNGGPPIIHQAPVQPNVKPTTREQVPSQLQLSKSATRSYERSSTAGPSKRPASPDAPNTEEQAKLKKAKVIPPPLTCPVCDRPPHHLVKDCPLVAAGPVSITKQIVRLEKNADASSVATVRVLRKLLSREKKKATVDDTKNVICLESD